MPTRSRPTAGCGSRRRWSPSCSSAAIPLIGVCLGSQLLAEAAGAAPGGWSAPEIGWREVELTPEGAEDPVTGALPSASPPSSGTATPPLSAGAVALARNDACLQAFRVGGSAWGVQFHPEVTLADAESWIGDITETSDAVRVGHRPEAFSSQTRAAMPAWNRLGRRLCAGFLAFARRPRARAEPRGPLLRA